MLVGILTAIFHSSSCMLLVLKVPQQYLLLFAGRMELLGIGDLEDIGLWCWGHSHHYTLAGTEHSMYYCLVFCKQGVLSN